jgi:hypothetical protein
MIRPIPNIYSSFSNYLLRNVTYARNGIYGKGHFIIDFSKRLGGRCWTRLIGIVFDLLDPTTISIINPDDTSCGYAAEDFQDYVLTVAALYQWCVKKPNGKLVNAIHPAFKGRLTSDTMIERVSLDLLPEHRRDPYEMIESTEREHAEQTEMQTASETATRTAARLGMT